MMEGAFYQPKRTSPAALAVVVLMHGAALTALALAKPEMLDKVKIPPIVVDFIKEKPLPPEEKPLEKVVTPRQETVITRVRPDVILPPMPGPTPVWKEPETAAFPDPGPIVMPPREPVITEPPKPRKVEPARARANLASYVSDADYPNAAIRNEEQGVTRFRLGVGPDGRVSECSVTGSSGSTALDSATCRLMKQRARFVPARDSDGRATSDTVSNAIRWVLPD